MQFSVAPVDGGSTALLIWWTSFILSQDTKRDDYTMMEERFEHYRPAYMFNMWPLQKQKPPGKLFTAIYFSSSISASAIHPNTMYAVHHLNITPFSVVYSIILVTVCI